MRICRKLPQLNIWLTHVHVWLKNADVYINNYLNTMRAATSTAMTSIDASDTLEDPPEESASPSAMRGAEFIEFEHAIKSKGLEWKLRETVIDMSLRLFFALVRKMYNSSIALMIEKSRCAGESQRYSTGIVAVAKEFHWSERTVKAYVCVLRKILNELPVDEGFKNTVKFLRAPDVYNMILGKKYGKLRSTHPVRELLESWIQKVREGTKNKSNISIRNIVAFYVSTALPNLELNIEEWPADPKPQIEDKFKDETCIESICGPHDNPNASKKARWLQFLLNDILGTTVVIPTQYLKNSQYGPNQGDEEDDGSDKRRISSEALDAIYKESTKNTRDELLFLLMITTGLRIGGTSRILIRHIADVEGQEYKVKSQGKTKEKGGKWVSFMLTKRVQELVLEWLTKHRPASTSTSLFPGICGGCISTDTISRVFHKLCANCGLSGKEYHPHALRHTYAHILLDRSPTSWGSWPRETGNSVDVVSKCLNHSSSVITEQFYLKENAAQVNERANIPWMQGAENKRKPSLPSFLGGTATDQTNTKHERSARKSTSNCIR